MNFPWFFILKQVFFIARHSLFASVFGSKMAAILGSEMAVTLGSNKRGISGLCHTKIMCAEVVNLFIKYVQNITYRHLHFLEKQRTKKLTNFSVIFNNVNVQSLSLYPVKLIGFRRGHLGEFHACPMKTF